MSRSLVLLILLLVVVAGALFYLSNSAEEVPMNTVEQEVVIGDGEEAGNEAE